MNSLRDQNMAKDIYKDPKNAEEIRKLESIEIKDGKMIIKARDRHEADEDAKSEDSPGRDPDGKVIVHPPHAEAGPAEQGRRPPKLPDDVRPPDPRPATPAEPAKKP